MKTKINDQNYPILKEIGSILAKSEKELEKHEHIAFLPFKSLPSRDLEKQVREGLTAIIKYGGNALEVDYLVYKLFFKLDNDDKFRQKCFEQAALIPENKVGCLLLPRKKGSNNSVSIVYNTVAAEDTQNKRKQLYIWVLVNNKIEAFEMLEIDSESKIYGDSQFCVYTLHSAAKLTMSYYMLAYLIFKNYATIESVDMVKEKARKTTKTLNKEEYELESRCSVPVTIIDSSWFREIKGDGFTVSGHLRFQYYPSTKTHKLIAIDAFEKTGYTRKAKKEEYEG